LSALVIRWDGTEDNGKRSSCLGPLSIAQDLGCEFRAGFAPVCPKLWKNPKQARGTISIKKTNMLRLGAEFYNYSALRHEAESEWE
jgi:hypothetical protein